MSDLLTLDVESIAAGGDGVCRHDGLVVFVPRTAPGDRISARVEHGKRLARGRVERIDRPSADRADPPCAHYEGDRCGGCQLQHLNVAAQELAKRGIIRDSMRRIGRRTIELPPLTSAPSPWRYRHRLSLALRRNTDGTWRAGLHAWDNPDRVFDLRDCLIAEPRVVELWREVMTAASELPDVPSLRGTVRLVGDRGAFTLEGGSAWPAAESFAAKLGNSFVGVWWAPVNGLRRAVRAPVDGIPSASFSQVNPAVAARLFDDVFARVRGATPSHVIDAYSGAGDLAARLHDEGVRVTAVEFDEEASRFSATRLPKPSRAIAARVEDVIGGLLPADVVVLNPPRSGVDTRVTAAIEGSDRHTRRVIYVSCDPATLARDIARMPSWKIVDVAAFDMFPQTAHVETVVELVRGVA
jgi:23S rRNA (uracil1939-C5)-methyltransferase